MWKLFRASILQTRCDKAHHNYADGEPTVMNNNTFGLQPGFAVAQQNI